jgi:hypothetical protein
VATERTSEADENDVNRVLQDWRQGDCTLDKHWFVHRLNPALAITKAGLGAAKEGAELAELEVAGLVVVSQTCDIVRDCRDRPYLEVCPLVGVSDDALHEIERGRRPAYAFVPRLAEQHLAADLDRVMTVEKPAVLNWVRTAGWSSDVEARTFAQALVRKRARFAFPDDFTLWARKLQNRLIDKHDKNTQEGRALRALREIRVQATPSWDSNAVELMFFFIRSQEDINFEGKEWQELLDAWLKLVPAAGRFTSVYGQVSSLDELTAADYIHSDQLDLDHLSSLDASF